MEMKKRKVIPEIHQTRTFKVKFLCQDNQMFKVLAVVLLHFIVSWCRQGPLWEEIRITSANRCVAEKQENSHGNILCTKKSLGKWVMFLGRIPPYVMRLSNYTRKKHAHSHKHYTTFLMHLHSLLTITLIWWSVQKLIWDITLIALGTLHW